MLNIFYAAEMEVNFFSPKSADFTDLKQIPEMEFQSYIENNPVHLIHAPLLIMKFIPPTPHYELKRNKIIFYYDKKMKHQAGEYKFHLSYENQILPILAIGSKKTYSPYGQVSAMKKTFYFLLPQQIMNQTRFSLIYHSNVNGNNQKEFFHFYYSSEKDTYLSTKEFNRERLYSSLKNQNRFSMIDRGGRYFFTVSFKQEEDRSFFNIEVKNLSGQEIIIYPDDFTLIFKDYQRIKPNMSDEISAVIIPPGSIEKFQLVFLLPELPKISKVYGFLRFEKGYSTFEKKLPFS